MSRTRFRRVSSSGNRIALTALMFLVLADIADAGPHPVGLHSEFRETSLHSGPRANHSESEMVVFAGVAHQQGAAWMRLHMAKLRLAGDSRIRYTSLLDGDVQEMDAAEAAMWNYTSAYFNGNAVLIELIASPGSVDNLVTLDRIEFAPLDEDAMLSACGICDGVDQRVPSDEDFAGRIMNPALCSATVFNADSCIVLAGHCLAGSSQVIQFRVPDSLDNCAIQHPPAIHQYPILDAVFNNGGMGNDWAVARTGLSSGMTIYERYGVYRPIADSVPTTGTIEIWGFGSSKVCYLNHTQQRSTGLLVNVSSTTITHRADTAAGSSGSAIIRNGKIIGVVTHCGTPCPPAANAGTRIDVSAFAAAIEQLCPSEPPLVPCPADLNGDREVDGADLLILLSSWGACAGCDADLNDDNEVDGADLLILLSAWGACP